MIIYVIIFQFNNNILDIIHTDTFTVVVYQIQTHHGQYDLEK